MFPLLKSTHFLVPLQPKNVQDNVECGSESQQCSGSKASTTSESDTSSPKSVPCPLASLVRDEYCWMESPPEYPITERPVDVGWVGGWASDFDILISDPIGVKAFSVSATSETSTLLNNRCTPLVNVKFWNIICLHFFSFPGRIFLERSFLLKILNSFWLFKSLKSWQIRMR